ncbi:MAG: universal stress protein [Thermodesulfobacteriota bacterium]
MYKNVLLPTDGLGKCRFGVCHGVQLAKGMGAKVTAVCVTGKLSSQDILKLYDVKELASASDAARAKEAMLGADETKKEEAGAALSVAKKMCDSIGVPCELAHLPGENPVDGILKVASEKKCDLIFISTHGNSGLFGSLFGTLATKIIAQSKVPVLVHHCGGPS